MRICNRCIMDESDPNIVFDEKGYCNHCTNAITNLNNNVYGLDKDMKKEALRDLIGKIKKSGEGKDFDCIVGLSGGVDSSYTLYLLKKWGLRPLAVHADNHWNSKEADENIENLVRMLEVPLVHEKVDWNEFKDMQLAFLRSSTPDSEVPSDNLIFAILYKIAKRYGINYIMAGYNSASESILPKAWSQGHFDKRYIKTIHKKFGALKKLNFPIISNFDRILYNKIFKIEVVKTLDYIDYNKEIAKEYIKKEFLWKDYGRKHGESIYTKIFQEYILPKKFGFDKRKAHYSSLIIAGQMKRNEALELLKEQLYEKAEDENEDIKLLCEKFGITIDEFENIMKEEPKGYSDYSNMDEMLFYKFLNLYSKVKRKMQ